MFLGVIWITAKIIHLKARVKTVLQAAIKIKNTLFIPYVRNSFVIAGNDIITPVKGSASVWSLHVLLVFAPLIKV